VSDADQSGAGRREVAYRIFAAEYDDADLSYSEGDEERAPNYVVTPTGARINRLFVVGVLTEVEPVSDDVLRARVVDPTGAFVLYAGQYQPDEQAFLDAAETPAFVGVTGKARTFQPDDSDRVFTSVRPETISEVDADTRDRWSVRTAEQTIDRVSTVATARTLGLTGDALESALADRGIDEGHAEGIALALEHYRTSPAYLQDVRQMAVDVARVVAGELEEADPVSLSPDAEGDVDIHALADDVDAGSTEPAETGAGATSGSAGTEDVATSDATADVVDSDDSTAGVESANDSATEAEPTAGGAVAGSTPAAGEDAEADATAGEGGQAASEPIGGEPTAGEQEPSTAAESPGGDESDSAGEGLGDFEAGGEADGAAAEVGEFDPDEFELDEAEREEIESEYGTEFQSGSEVAEPGEADIETPDPASGDSTPSDAGTEVGSAGTPETTSGESTAGAGEASVQEGDTDPEAETATGASDPGGEATDSGGGSDAETDETGSSEPDDSGGAETGGGAGDDAGPDPANVDLEDAVVEVMGELDGGSGADREALVETVAERYGASSETVEDAIQDALMDGRCYEPDEGTLKPI